MNLKKCQHCGKSIGIHDDFCPFCQGNILIKNDNNESLIEIDKECENCGVLLSKNAKYCHKCGNEIYIQEEEKKMSTTYLRNLFRVRRLSRILRFSSALIVLYIFYIILKFIGSLD